MHFKRFILAAIAAIHISACSTEGESDLLLQAITLAELDAAAIQISTSQAVDVLAIGETVQLVATAQDAMGGSVGDVTSIVSWSADSNAVSISSSGLVTANTVTGVVDVEITATLAQITVDVADRINIDVSDAPLVGVQIDASTLTVDECQTQTLVANGIYDDDGDGTVAGDTARTQPLDVTWNTDATSDIADITNASSGVINTYDAGTPNVTATSVADNTITTTSAITISDTLSVLAIDQTSFDLALQATRTLSLTGTYGSGDLVVINTLANWVSDNNEMDVSGSGVVTAEGEVTASITAECGGVTSAALSVTGEEYSTYRVVIDGSTDTSSEISESSSTTRTVQLVMQGSIDGGDTFDDLDEDLVDWDEVSSVTGFSVNSTGEVSLPATFPDEDDEYQVDATFTRPDIDGEARFTFTLNQ